MSLNELVQESEQQQAIKLDNSPEATKQPNTQQKFIDYDELLSELAVPSHNQHLYEQEPENLENNQESGNNQQSTFNPYPVTREPVDPERALRSGRRIAKMVDAVLAGGATIYAKSDDFSEYKATDEDIDDLSEAWADVSQEYNIEMNPWFNVAFLSLATYGPLYFKASNDRRFNLMQKQINEINEKLSAKEQSGNASNIENNKSESATSEPQKRTQKGTKTSKA
jgi:hypothetical protein